MAELDPRAAGGKRPKDKVCVVTGADQGIGRATARRLVQRGGNRSAVRYAAAPGKTTSPPAPHWRGHCGTQY